MPEYNNSATITSGRKVVTQVPIDDRHYFSTVQQISVDINNKLFFSWFRFMPIYISSLHQVAIWLSVDEATLLNVQDAQIPGTTAVYNDPVYAGTIYENKAYQFYRLMAVPTAHTHTESEIVGLNKYTQAQVNQLLASKQSNLPANATGNIAVLYNDNGSLYWSILNIISNPETVGYHVRETMNWVSIFNPGLSPILGKLSSGIAKLADTIIIAGGTYVLEEPALLPDKYSVHIIHDGFSGLAVQLSGQTIDGVSYTSTVPFSIPQYKSVLLCVINGEWRRLNNMP